MIGRRLTSGLLVLVAVCPAWGDAEQEIRAAWSETRQIGEKLLRDYADITYQELEGRVRIVADSARVWVEDDRYLFGPNVAFEDSTRQVQADTLEYRLKTQTAIFRGHVRVREEKRRLATSRLVYHLEDHLLVIPGYLEFEYPLEGMGLEAEDLRYFARKDSGVIGRGAQVHKLPEAEEDTLVMQADSLIFARQGRWLSFSGAVRLDQGKMEARAGRALFSRSEGQILLQDRPRISWRRKRETEIDTVLIGADRIEGKVEDGEIRDLELFTGVEIQIRPGGAGETRTIQADSARVTRSSDALERLNARGRVRITLKSGDRVETELEGDTLDMAFREGDLDSLVLSGRCRGKYVPEHQRSESLLSGGRKIIWFEGREIRRMVIEDNAVCEQVPLVKAENRILVTGDRVELFFEAGDVQEVAAAGGVKGNYRPAKKEQAP